MPRLIDMTDLELIDSVSAAVDKVIASRMAETVERIKQSLNATKVYTINELVKLKLIGGRDKIKTLINNGSIHVTPDGRVTQLEIDKFLTTKKYN